MTDQTQTPEQLEAARLAEIAHEAANARAARILARPAFVRECVAAALDIASAELVNLRAASEYLQGSYPDYFKSVNEAEEAILDADEAAA